MALLIDGYNLLHVTDIFGSAVGAETALHASRHALLDYLASALDAKARAATTIVFDAAGAPPGLPQTLSHEGITVRFARRHSDADEMIEDLIEAHPAPRSLVVVSSDHRVQRAARRRGATYVDSDRWFEDLRTVRRNLEKAADAIAKPTAEMTPEQVDYWVKKFAEPAANEEPESLFPPGYAEDLLDE
jgi:predicted RNA-binding protein with PIN domain